MDDSTKTKLAINASNATRMASNWVMAAAGAMFAIWLALPPEQQQALIAHLPVPAWVLPVLTSIAGIVARLWPQSSITPAVAAAKSGDAPQPAEPLGLLTTPSQLGTTSKPYADSTRPPAP